MSLAGKEELRKAAEAVNAVMSPHAPRVGWWDLGLAIAMEGAPTFADKLRQLGYHERTHPHSRYFLHGAVWAIQGEATRTRGVERQSLVAAACALALAIESLSKGIGKNVPNGITLMLTLPPAVTDANVDDVIAEGLLELALQMPPGPQSGLGWGRRISTRMRWAEMAAVLVQPHNEFYLQPPRVRELATKLGVDLNTKVEHVLARDILAEVSPEGPPDFPVPGDVRVG